MAETIIGSTLVIDGEITGDEALIVQGNIKGRITLSQSVFIENSATLQADIEAESVEIAGVLTGNITATNRVEIKAEGKCIGDIKSPRILIADGALFKGNIDMDVGR